MILGIDTSCYTTSLAVTNSYRELIYEKRKVLSVNEGERGLQQSKALFQHMQNVPSLIAQALNEIDKAKLQAVCVSAKPRPLPTSYMPVFMAGVNFASVLANALGKPLVFTSHQEGHIEAGVWSTGAKLGQKFIALHLSGGTSEVLLVEPNGSGGYKVEKLGGTIDLHAGQFIDRVGVALGLSFPAGPLLEKLAQESSGGLRIPSRVKGLDLSFSGPETAAQRLIIKGENGAEIARAVEHNIATTVEKVVRNIIDKFSLKDILIVGGVAANGYIRMRLRERLQHKSVGAKLFFAEPKYSTDNAVGVSLIGWFRS